MSNVLKLRRTLGDDIAATIDTLKPEFAVLIAMKDHEIYVQALQDMHPAYLLGMLEMAKRHFIEEAYAGE